MGGPIIFGIMILAVIGAGAINLGAQGFTATGMDAGFGHSFKGKAARFLGVVLIVLGLVMVYPLFWFVTGVLINMVKTPPAG